MPEGLRVLEAAAERFGFELEFTHIDWASCDYYAAARPDDAGRLEGAARGMDAIYFGAVGWPATVPDHVSLWGSLLKFRREFDQYINLRPVRLFEGVPCPLAGRKPGDIDFFVVRENTEGEYTDARRRDVRRHRARDRDPGVGVLAPRHRPRAAVRLRAGQRARAQAPDGGDQEQRHRDQHAVVGRAAPTRWRRLPRGDGRQAAHRHPDARASCCSRTRFDVVVASNLFGDILSDLGPAMHRHDRPGAVGQPQSGAQVPVAVRAGARLGARHRRQGHRQPDRDDLVGRADAGFPDAGQGAGRAAHDAIVDAIERCCARARARATSAATPDHRDSAGRSPRACATPSLREAIYHDATPDRPVARRATSSAANGATRSDGRRLDVTDPATDTVFASVPDSGAADARAAVDAAHAAFPDWRAVPAKQRAQILKRWNDLILAHQEDLGR